MAGKNSNKAIIKELRKLNRRMDLLLLAAADATRIGHKTMHRMGDVAEATGIRRLRGMSKLTHRATRGIERVAHGTRLLAKRAAAATK